MVRVSLLAFAVVAFVLPARAERVTVQKLAPLSIGLAGYSGAEEASEDSAALRQTLQKRLHREVTTRVFETYDALATALAKGEVDVGWMQPLAFVAAEKQAKVTPLVKAVRRGLPFYRGVLFTRADRKVDGLSGLKGLSVAWVSKSSAAGYLFPRASIVQAGLVPSKLFKTESFEGDHAAVCRAVLEGQADVGATFADDRAKPAAMQLDGCVQALGSDAGRQLKIVATSAPIPNDVLAARPGLDAKELASLKKAFLSLPNDAAGRELLRSVFKAEKFDEVGPDDFVPVRFAAESAGQ